MRKHRSAVITLVVSVVFSSGVVACLWDYDTLQMERQQFPSALELITGEFLRHTPEFYKWRIADRLKKLEAAPERLEYYDDLAVAYDKVGEQKKAIETILRKEEKKPGLYETYANLGTFYIHSGEFERGIEYIDKAIAINPDAHFGREIYQKRLVEYVLSKTKGGPIKLPLASFGLPAEANDLRTHGFARFLKEAVEDRSSGDLTPSERDAAIKGVLGMMKFGKHDSPILLEALGDLLCGRQANEMYDAKRLAARAYLKASYEVEEDEVRKAYRRMAQQALSMQTVGPHSSQELTLEELEKDFKLELAEANDWYASVRGDELRWIAEGKNPEEEFTKKYYQEPEISSVAEPLRFSTDRFGILIALLTIGCLALMVTVGLVVRYRWRAAK